MGNVLSLRKNKPEIVIHQIKYLRENAPELLNWIKRTIFYSLNKKIIVKELDGGININDTTTSCPTTEKNIFIELYSNDFKYSIMAIPKAADGKKSYLSCSSDMRKPLAGETWNRGHGIHDGLYSKETWDKIVIGIVNNEIICLETDFSMKELKDNREDGGD